MITESSVRQDKEPGYILQVAEKAFLTFQKYQSGNCVEDGFRRITDRGQQDRTELRQQRDNNSHDAQSRGTILGNVSNSTFIRNIYNESHLGKSKFSSSCIKRVRQYT